MTPALLAAIQQQGSGASPLRRQANELPEAHRRGSCEALLDLVSDRRTLRMRPAVLLATSISPRAILGGVSPPRIARSIIESYRASAL